MRSWLRSFLAWMDKRFPEKVVITQAEFIRLKETVDKIQKLPDIEGRLKMIEAEINKFNAHMGFGGSVIPKGMAQPFQR